MSFNFLSPRVVDLNKNSDTMSEVSENGTATSGWTSNWDSREDLRDFVTKLGLRDVSDLYQDRFRVDRRKLEQMLTGDNDALIPADVFFAKIMEDTDTFITWPNKLKIGAKSKKDPHVRIAGRPQDVEAAKERIMTILDTRCNRVTMKMDVSYTDHSHIIGKGGLSIKRVMEETQCHVHFPDSNRSNPTEKSNQVSISGDIEGVECARSRVRELIPLIFGFELPIMSQNIDVTSAYVVKIQEQYKVQVMFKTRPKLHATLVLVKGVEWEVDQVKQATLLLMDYMCDKLASQIPVQMSMEISPHHHPIVLGKNHSNLKQIMQLTNCQIMFPDATDPNIPSLKKSNISISGNIHNVYKARQLLMGNLPLIIIFDLPEASENLRIRSDQISEIQSSCDLVINIRQKAKQNTKSCVIKGIERHVVSIYKARNMILGIDEPPICADIPPSYMMSAPSPASPFSPSDLLPTPTNINPPPISPMLSPMVSPNWQFPMPSVPSNPPFVGMTQQPQFVYNVMQQSLGSSGYHSASHLDVSSQPAASLSSNSISSPLPSPHNSNSPSCYRNFMESPSELSSVLSDVSNLSSFPGAEKKGDRSMTNYDYENKRLAGIRAMQIRPTPGTFRLPNNSWSGYGLSHTSPAAVLREKTGNKKSDDVWTSPSKSNDGYGLPSTSSSALNTSNLLDQTPSHIIQRVTSTKWSDLPSMLTSLGLERYIGLFATHEIDLGTFVSLNDQDLVEIGINAFGARRKMLLAISEMNKRASPFSAAPGAERKSTSSTSSSMSPRDW
ncbi:protein bicaudal C [Aethina tumida]|uniref:protein bicaudal C n=1 Tax=Aethina tumida TaxID=116153 RepID=UPI00096B34F6|nr:protein bicaudal C [Aethina tumida]